MAKKKISNDNMTRRLLYQMTRLFHWGHSDDGKQLYLTKCDHPACVAVCKELRLDIVPSMEDRPDMMFGCEKQWQEISRLSIEYPLKKAQETANAIHEGS